MGKSEEISELSGYNFRPDQLSSRFFAIYSHRSDFCSIFLRASESRLRDRSVGDLILLIQGVL
jgi:hypothetical protein